MSRTPLLNADEGKDHLGWTSALLIGAGVTGGQAYGGTDDNLAALPVDFASGQPDDAGGIFETDHFVAGLLELVGVDPAAHLRGITPFSPFVAA